MRRADLISAIWLLVVGVWLAGAGRVRGQSQDQAQSKGAAQGQTSKDAPANTSQKGSQAPNQAESETAQEGDSLAAAARKTKENKAKAATGKVYTEEDMSGLSSRGVSVVGQGNAGGAGAADDGYSGAQPKGNSATQPAKNEEAFWRGRARQLLDQMTATDQQIEKVKEEIKKYGNGGFDPSTGLGKNVIYVDDRQSQLTRLEKQRADLDRQMDQLQEEGRKAGAAPSWFR